MCCRYLTPQELASLDFGGEELRNADMPRPPFKAAPTTMVPIIRLTDDGQYELCEGRWGLIPSWWKQDKPPKLTFNARSEEAAFKPTWRDSYRQERCLMPAQGWYEWCANKSVASPSGKARVNKQPYFIFCPSSAVIAFAGLLSHGHSQAGQMLWSCAMLTKAAAPSIGHIHERMPVVLAMDSFAAWLSGGQGIKQIDQIVASAREDFVAIQSVPDQTAP